MRRDPLGVVGQTVDGKYDVTELVERHGPRLVYKAMHRTWGEPTTVVFCMPDPHVGRSEATTAARGFLRAGVTMARLAGRSAAFVQVRDAGTWSGAGVSAPYLVYEWIDGITLTDALAASRKRGRSRMALDAVLDWFAEPMRALGHAHDVGVVHGHLDPDNVVILGKTLDPRAPIKLRGFTEAAWLASTPGGSGLPRVAHPNYAAPELSFHDASRLAPWTDVFGLARVFGELLTGNVPRPASRATSLGLAQELDFALSRAMSPQVEERFRSIDAFRSALANALELESSDRVRGRSPRRTMVVSEAIDVMAGSAGAFEIAVDAPEPFEDEPAPDVVRPRVRLAFTQRASVADIEALMSDRATVPMRAVPRAVERRPTPNAAAASAFGAEVFGKHPQTGPRWWPMALGGVVGLTMLVYLINLMSIR